MHRNITLHDVQFNWLTVLEPKRFKPDDPARYQAEILIEDGSDTAKMLEEAVFSAASEKWPGKEKGHVATARANLKCAVKFGDKMPPDKNTGEIPEHYKGRVVVSSSRRLDRDGPLRCFSVRKSTGRLVELTQDTNFDGDLVEPKRGCKGKAMISLWAWEHGGSPQINCTVESLMFEDEGEPISANTALTVDAIAGAFGREVEEEVTF